MERVGRDAKRCEGRGMGISMYDVCRSRMLRCTGSRGTLVERWVTVSSRRINNARRYVGRRGFPGWWVGRIGKAPSTGTMPCEESRIWRTLVLVLGVVRLKSRERVGEERRREMARA